MVAVPAAMKAAGKPRAVGLLVAKELEVIDGLMATRSGRCSRVMGGAKVSDKIGFIKALLAKVDQLLIGGEMTYTFLKAQGVDVGGTQGRRRGSRPPRSRCCRTSAAKIVLPVDSLAREVGRPGTDAGVSRGRSPTASRAWTSARRRSRCTPRRSRPPATVIWNGPVGWFEKPAFSSGHAGRSPRRWPSRGASRSSAAARRPRRSSSSASTTKMTHVSTGGGAFLAYVEGKKFASLAQIDDK